MKGKFLLFSLILSVLSLLSCGPRNTPVEKAPPETGGIKQPVSTEKTGWEADWEKTIQNARKEGKVLVYGTQTIPALKEVSPAFNKKFGVSLEVVSFSRGADSEEWLARDPEFKKNAEEIFGQFIK